VFEDSRSTDKLVIYDKDINLSNGNFDVKQPKGETIALPVDEPLGLECRHFIECVRDRRTPRTPGENGVEVLQVLQACQRSLQMNGDPVQVTHVNAQQVAAI